MMYILKPNDKISFNITYFISPACSRKALHTNLPMAINLMASDETENQELPLSTLCARTPFSESRSTHLLCSCLQPSSLESGFSGQNCIYGSSSHSLEYYPLVTPLKLCQFHMPSIEKHSL